MRIVSFEELKPRYGIPYCRSHLLRLQTQGNFPLRIKLGYGRMGWDEAEIEAYLQARAAERFAEPGNAA